jgi:hypothetical protein
MIVLHRDMLATKVSTLITLSIPNIFPAPALPRHLCQEIVSALRSECTARLRGTSKHAARFRTLKPPNSVPSLLLFFNQRHDSERNILAAALHSRDGESPAQWRAGFICIALLRCPANDLIAFTLRGSKTMCTRVLVPVDLVLVPHC